MDLNSAYICHTCLSLDRRLYPLTNFSPLIQLNFLPKTAKMCWECGNIVLKFTNFITKAVTAQSILMDVQQNDDIVCLSTLEFSKHQPLYEFKHIDDKISEQDSEETISVKEEVVSTDTENEMYHEDAEQINYNTHDDEENSEKDITNEDKNMLNIEINFDNVKVETENAQQKPEITWTKKGEALLDAENRFSDVPEEVMKKILVTELTDEELLNKREQKRSKLQNVKYKCDFCIIGFTTQENLTKHMTKHKHIDYNNLNAPVDEPRDCDICKRRFITKYLAQKHRENHYIKYECRLCKYRAHDLSVIVAHCKKNHDKEPVAQTVCDLCPVVKSFRTPEEYIGHWKWEHSSCEICGHTSRTKGSQQRHMKREHKPRGELICDHCTKCFTSKSELEIHMSTHDENIAKTLSYCDVCKIQFKHVRIYRYHLKTSTNHVKERLQCTECDKQFVTEFYRKRHYKFYHLKKCENKCDECDKMFITEWRLTNHKRIHHGLKRPRNYECNDCGKKFHNLQILKNHYSVHSDLRPFMCSECGDTFKFSGALYTHTKFVHKLGKKLYKKQKKINE